MSGVSSLRGYDRRAYRDAYDGAAKRPFADVEQEFEKLDNRLNEIHDAALGGEGDGWDAEAVLALAGKNELIPEGASFGDINAKLVEVNAIHHALGDFISFQREMEASADRLKRGLPQRDNGGITPLDNGNIPVVPQRSQVLSEILTDEVWAAHESAGKFQNSVVNPMATLFQTSDGVDPGLFVTPQPGYVGAITKPLQLINLIPSQMTSSDVVQVLYETVNNPQAQETAEGAALPEAEYQFAMTEFNVRTLGHWLPVTEQQSRDVEFVRGYLNDRLSLGVMQRLDRQILLGAGTTNDLRGIMNYSDVGEQGKVSNEKSWKTIKKAMTKVWLDSYARASALVIHPSDWDKILTSESSAGGLYISRGPQEVALDRLWGIPVVETNHLTAGTALVGDFRSQARIFYRQGIEIGWGLQNDQFVKLQMTVRAFMRCCIVVYRGQAFCKVTGI